MSTKKEDLESHEDQTQDAVFGEITEEGPNYRSVRIPPFRTKSFAVDPS